MLETKEVILVTGGAGFIGSHLIDKLLEENKQVICIDNYDPFYAKDIKLSNQKDHRNSSYYTFIECDISDGEALRELLPSGITTIVHLAAKAGVRPSIQTPLAYQEVNVKGTHNLLEYAKEQGIKQFVFASSSSVYGINPKVPWSESDHVLLPISPYASTKVSCELLGHTYSHLYDIRFIALRFFTVYGPRQRPDLAINKFARLMTAGDEIPMFGDGSTRRDYTFVHDIVSGIRAAIDYDASPYEVINLGNSQTVSLREMIQTIGEVFEVEPKINQLPMQPGDVPQTYADISKAREILSYNPQTTFKEGITAFREWVLRQSLIGKNL
ncbi:MAG: GDP-mannose 4,6-dehydratase [Bacteroidota bacterium]